MKQTTQHYLMLTTIIVLQFASALITWWAYDKTEEVQIYATNMYMLLNAMSWVLAFGIIALLSTGLFRQLVIIACLLWIGNVIDEIFFDPTIPQWNDLANVLIAENIALVALTRHLLSKS